MPRRKTKKDVLTPLEEKVLEKVKGKEYVYLSDIQRALNVTLYKAIELAIRLKAKGLIESNADKLEIRPPKKSVKI